MMSRPTFRNDALSALFGAVSMGAVAPAFTQLFVQKGFEGPDWLLSVVVAELALGNLLGSAMGAWLRSRQRVPYVVGARLAVAVVMCVMALLPLHPSAGYVYVVLLLVPALSAAVLMNVRSSVWHSNYPHHLRGAIFSRILVLQVAATAIAIKLAGAWLDAWPHAHRAIYPIAAGFSLISAVFYGRIRVRRERAQQQVGRQQRFRPLAGLALLVRDRTFGWFMLLQGISASMIHLCAAPTPLMLLDVFRVSYSQGADALALVPMGVQLAMASLMGRLFDRAGPYRFRASEAGCFAGSRLLVLAGLAVHSWPLTLVGFAWSGLASSMGAVSFSISHTRFAGPDQGPMYMGVNMTLQGLRGLTMPFLGVWLYHQPWMGLRLLGVTAGVQLLAAAGFYLSPEPSRRG